MNIRFFITVAFITTITITNAYLNNRKLEIKRNLYSIAGVVIVAILGGWDLLATIAAVGVYGSICYFGLVIHEESVVFALLGAVVLSCAGIWLSTYMDSKEISRETYYEERINLNMVDDYFVKTDVDKNDLYYIYYVEDEEGVNAEKIDAQYANVRNDSKDEAYIEREYADVAYVNDHFGGMTYVEKHMFQRYVIHIPEGGIR